MNQQTSSKFEFKPPVVTIVGHVDHGKTTLLDYLRASRLTDKESGGITQKIGAYQYSRGNQQFTFIDTPGHAAFTKIRQRSVAVTDVVILVIAANDGVKPQTVESIKLIKQAGIPFVVAINKIDLKNTNLDQIKTDLAKHDVLLEDYGGQIPYVLISAKIGTGIDKLLDTIWLLGQMEQKPYTPAATPATGVVIESILDPKRGSTASIIVNQGSFKQGVSLYQPGQSQPVGKIRRMFNDLGQPVELAAPSQPVAIIGLKSLPPVGTLLTDSASSTKIDSTKTTPPSTKQPVASPVKSRPDPSIETDTSSSTVLPTDKPSIESVLVQLPLLVKADSTGSLEAVLTNLPLEKLYLVGSGVGPVTESDVLSAAITGAAISAFSTSVPTSVTKLAIAEGVTIYNFDIIYKLLEKIDELILCLQDPSLAEEVVAQAKVLKIFDYKTFTVIGCEVLSGKLTKNYSVHVNRGDRILGDAKITSLKVGQQDTGEITTGQECGLILSPSLDLKPDDMLVSYKTEK